jgi:4-hydroxyphenylpyruvate dioxygenase-like putative hemolysin
VLVPAVVAAPPGIANHNDLTFDGKTLMPEQSPLLHHVVFAVAPKRHATVAQMFTDLGFAFENFQLTELGLDIHLDWDRGIELISPIPGSPGSVAVLVNEFLERHGDGVYTVVIGVPAASLADAVAQRYGATTRFRQHFEGDGSHLDEIDLSVLGLPLTFLATNIA